MVPAMARSPHDGDPHRVLHGVGVRCAEQQHHDRSAPVHGTVAAR